MLKKIKKLFPAVVSAVLCVTMLLGVTVSAEKKNAVDASVWKETKAITNAKYYSKYIKLASKYSEKDGKNTVTYDKSRMKKFADRFFDAVYADDPQFSFSLTDKESIVYFAVKGEKYKSVIYYELGVASYSDGKKTTYLSVDDKIKATDSESTDSKETASVLAADLNYIVDISENAKGKVFKIKSDEKIYYYEEFEAENYIVGMLFSENDSPLAFVMDDEVYCISFSTKVDDSEFDIPKGYKTIDYDDYKY